MQLLHWLIAGLNPSAESSPELRTIIARTRASEPAQWFGGACRKRDVSFRVVSWGGSLLSELAGIDEALQNRNDVCRHSSRQVHPRAAGAAMIVNRFMIASKPKAVLGR